MTKDKEIYFNFTSFMDADREKQIAETQKAKHPDLYNDPEILKAIEDARKEPATFRTI